MAVLAPSLLGSDWGYRSMSPDRSKKIKIFHNDHYFFFSPVGSSGLIN